MDVRLREMTLRDAEVLSSWATDPLFCDHAGWRRREGAGDAVPWWRASISSPDPLLTRRLAVVDDAPVGYIDLHGDASDTRELGFVVGPSRRWGQGLGTAVADAALSYGFGVVGLSCIWAEAVEANVASVRILQRIGMRKTGLGEEELFLGITSRYLRFALSRAEWLATSRQDAATTVLDG